MSKQIAFADLKEDDPLLNQTLLKLATFHFKVDDDAAVVTLSQGTVRIVDSDVDAGNSFKWSSYFDEGVCMALYQVVKQCASEQKGIIDCLREYEGKYSKDGQDLIDTRYVKFFNPTQPKELDRADCGRTWIDYPAQFKTGSTIHDIHGGFGLWAVVKDDQEQIENHPALLRRYGHSIMEVQTIPGQSYVKLPEEVIGDQFKVVKTYQAKSIL